MEKIVIVATSTVDPITENISLSKIKDYWCFDMPMFFGEMARKSIEGIPIDMRRQMQSLIFCTLSSDEKSRAQIYSDIANGKSRSKPSTVLEAAGLNTRISLCGDLDVNPDIYNVQAACATGLKALELGMMTARLKDQVVVVGACDKMTTDFNLTFFNSLGAIAKGETFSGPFDKNRSGFAMGVGAAFVVICTESKARENNWQPVAFIDNIISCTKPVHPTNPSDIEFIASLVQSCIDESSISIDQIAHWNAHATCTPMGDDLEYQTYLKIVGNEDIPISSLKGRIGHTMGPSALIETIHGISSLKKSQIFANDLLTDPVADDYRILKKSVHTEKKSFIKTSFGFGGRNSVAVFTVP
jgi:3-oxoacyl-(acyl-carrier-protein) synthase